MQNSNGGFVDKLKKDYRLLRNGQPGRRFRDFVKKRRESRGNKWTVGRALTFALGILLIIGGAGIGWIPGPGGFIAIIGLAIVSLEIPWIAGLLDFAERATRSVIRHVKKFFGAGETTKKQPKQAD